jgi:hypothetical protein
MTAAELSQLICRRLMAKAETDPDPIAFVAKAAARLHCLSLRAQVSGDDVEAELIKFGQEMGILAPELKTVN